MDWIHCNSCFKQPRQSEPERIFVLTNCGHIYCEPCSRSFPDSVCAICASKFTSIHLNEDMKPEVQEYFQNTESLVKKAHEVLIFQNGHRQRLASHSRTVSIKYAAAKEEVRKLCTLLNAKEKRIREVEVEAAFWKKRAQNNFPFPVPPVQPSHRAGVSHISSVPAIYSGGIPSANPHVPHDSPGHYWLTPNRLTLQYKSTSGSSINVNPSPDSTITPSKGQARRRYRNYHQYSSQESTPGSITNSQPRERPGYSPRSAPDTMPCGNYQPQDNQRRRSQYYDSTVPSITPPNMAGLDLRSTSMRRTKSNDLAIPDKFNKM